MGQDKVPKGTLLVTGASGDVGAGIVRAAASKGWTVVGAGRSEDKLARVGAALPSGSFVPVAGNISDEDGARALWASATRRAGPIDAVVVAVNTVNRSASLLDWTADELSDVLRANLLTHFIAAKTWLPNLGPAGTFIGIGGGAADTVFPGLGQLSMGQAALRMLYRGLAKEQGPGPRICELLLVSMINGASKRDQAKPEWLTDDDVGNHICSILEEPSLFPGPILYLKTREAVGRPDPGDSKGRRT